MKTTTLLSLTLVLVAPLVAAQLAGCASDPNKRIKDASAQEAAEMRAEQEAQIEHTKKQEDKRIDAMKPETTNLPPASEERAKAQADMGEERQKFGNDARARLQKVQARLEESRQKLQLAGGDVPTSIHDQLNQTSKLANNLSDRIDHLPQVSNDRWSSEKKRLDDQLSDVEKSTDDVKSKVDSYRK
ncbi:MAG: hypothetical protein JWO86_886 [Myxococcaceae bacterium]|jgi:chromosome segregation ATPase|nr:hypothetical protein [Myxococcaceae bacterium]MEA2748350.1 hypothetical protein [Myxococcales bacterium]